MAVAADGEQWGTVGGGRIEQLVVAGGARGRRRCARARVVRQHLVRDLAMCCGGTMEVAITPAARRRALAIGGPRRRGASPLLLVTPLDGGPLAARRSPRARRCARISRAIEGDALVERIGARARDRVRRSATSRARSARCSQRSASRWSLCDDGDTGALAAAPAWADERHRVVRRARGRARARRLRRRRLRAHRHARSRDRSAAPRAADRRRRADESATSA